MLLYASLTDLQSTLQEFTEVNQSVSLVKLSPSSVLADHCKFKILVWKRCKYCLQCHNTHKNTSVWKLNSPYLVCHGIFCNRLKSTMRTGSGFAKHSFAKYFECKTTQCFTVFKSQSYKFCFAIIYHWHQY